MAVGLANPARSPIVGGLRLPPAGHEGETAAAPDPQQRVPMLIELNVRYPGGLVAVTAMFYRLWDDYASQAAGTWPAEANSLGAVGQPVPPLLAVVAPGLYQCVLSRATVHDMVEQDPAPPGRQASRRSFSGYGRITPSTRISTGPRPR